MRQRLVRFVVLALSWSLLAMLSAGCGLFRFPAAAPADPPAPPPVIVTPAPKPPQPQPLPTPVDVEAAVIAAVAQDLGVSESFVRAYLAGAGIDVAQRLAAAGIGPDEVDGVIAEARARGVDTPLELRAFITEVAQRPPAP